MKRVSVVASRINLRFNLAYIGKSIYVHAMTSKTNPILIIVAAILATFSLSHAEPPEYFSAVTVELKEAMREAVLGKLNAVAKQDRNVQIKQRQKTSLWEIGVYDTNPNRAAEKANRIAVDVRDAVTTEFRKPSDAELEQLKLQLQRLRAELEKNTPEQLRNQMRAAEQNIRDAVIRKPSDAELKQLKLQLQRLGAELEKNTPEQLHQEVRAAQQKYDKARFDIISSAVIPLVIWEKAVPAVNPIGPDVKR